MGIRSARIWLWVIVLFAGTIRLTALPNAQPNGDWVALDYAQFLNQRPYDGDSFSVRSDQQDYDFELYFVDTPEATRDNLTLLGGQARQYGLSLDETLELGQEARDYTARFLASGSRILTRWERVGDPSRRPRFFAVVVRNQDQLAEQLVARGLGSLNDHAPDAPWYLGVPLSDIQQRLQTAQMAARNSHIGAWRYEADDILAFLEPSMPGVSSSQAPNTPSNHTPVQSRINLNYATERELQRLRGIGPLLAQRIVANRPYDSIEDLRRVPGITESTLDRLRPYLMVER